MMKLDEKFLDLLLSWQSFEFWWNSSFGIFLIIHNATKKFSVKYIKIICKIYGNNKKLTIIKVKFRL